MQIRTYVVNCFSYGEFIIRRIQAQMRRGMTILKFRFAFVFCLRVAETGGVRA